MNMYIYTYMNIFIYIYIYIYIYMGGRGLRALAGTWRPCPGGCWLPGAARKGPGAGHKGPALSGPAHKSQFRAPYRGPREGPEGRA